MSDEKKYCERPGCKAFATQTYNLLDLCDLHYTEALGDEDVECVLETRPSWDRSPTASGLPRPAETTTDAPPSTCEAPRGCNRPAIREIDGKKLCGVHYTGVLNSKRMKGKKYAELFPQQKRQYRKRGAAAPPVSSHVQVAPGAKDFRVLVTRTQKNGSSEMTFSTAVSEKDALEIMVYAMGVKR